VERLLPNLSNPHQAGREIVEADFM
jgi:hypothetical protein